jgi:hypothetical protein
MPARIAGRLLTSPLAFLIAGIVDVVAFVGESVHKRLTAARR